MDIGSNKRLRGFPNILNLYLVLQLKSTTDWEVKNDHIHFALKASNYTMLRDPASYLPQYLILYTMPMSRVQWIRHQDTHSEFRDTAYFLSLRDFPDLVPRTDGKPRVTKTVRVPIANRLTATSLLRIYREECERVVRMRDGT
jgi:hypothetical protein